MPEAGHHFSLATAQEYVAQVFRAHQVSPANALSVARSLVLAEASGHAGHGFSRVASYALQARVGKVNGIATPQIETLAPARLSIDAQHGFAFPAIDMAIDALVQLTPRMGVACATVYRSHHCGALGLHVEALAQQGLVALMVCNAPAAMAAWGGARPLFGTNPIAFAVPRLAHPPLVIDLSMSTVARGKVMAAAKAGQSIPLGWALDHHGQPTTDANAALSGTMLPMGEVKGALLALMVEVLAGSLTGANYSFEATSFFDADGPPPAVGHTILTFFPQDVNVRHSP